MNELYIRFSFFLIVSITSFLLLLMSSNILLEVFILMVFSLFLVYVNPAKDVLSPINWFVPFSLAYSIVYPLYLVYFDLIDISSKYLILCSFISIFAFSLVNFEKTPSIISISHNHVKYKSSSTLLVIFFSFLVLISLGAALYIGVESKREFIDESRRNFFLSLIRFVYPLTFLYVYHLVVEVGYKGKISIDTSMILLLILFIIIFAVTGERDSLFRIMLCVFLVIYSFKNNYKKYYLFLVLLLTLFILPITQLFKGFLVSGVGFAASGEIAMREVLFGEFSASSRNIHTLFKYGWDYNYGAGIINDFQKVLPIIGSDLSSTTGWYNSVYRVENGIDGSSGWGFSLIGQGLLEFGFIGVFLIFLLLGLLVRWVRRLSFGGELNMALYIYFVTMVIYGLRADLSYILSQGLKNSLLTLLILFFTHSIIRSHLKKEVV